MSVQEVNDSEFEQQVLKSEKPVLVDFWAPWCGPCRAMAPVIDSFAEEKGADIKVVKVNIDKNKVNAHKYGVRSIPSFIFFKNGAAVKETVGGMSGMDLSDWVESNL